MKILITGASGFIGAYIIEKLQKKHNIGALILPNERLTNAQNVEIFPGDITCPETLEKAVSWAEIIIHCAGVIQSPKNETYYRINTAGTENLKNAVIENNPKLKLFILLSSLAVARPLKNLDTLIDEDTEPDPIDHYGRSKLLAEKVLSDAPFPRVILRLPSIYGGGSKEYIILMKLVSKRIIPKLGTRNNHFSMLHVSDLARCIETVVENRKSLQPIYYLSDGQKHSTDAIAETISSLFPKKSFTLTVPLIILKAIATFNELLGKITKRTSLLSPEKVIVLTSDFVCSPRRFHDQFGTGSYISLKDGMKQTLEWYREQGWMK